MIKDFSNIYNKNNARIAVLDLLNTLNEMFDTLVKTASVYEDGSYAENAGGVKPELIPYRSRIEELKKYIVRHINEKLELDDLAEVFREPVLSEPLL